VDQKGRWLASDLRMDVAIGDTPSGTSPEAFLPTGLLLSRAQY
jgi:hypothetical protein